MTSRPRSDRAFPSIALPTRRRSLRVSLLYRRASGFASPSMDTTEQSSAAWLSCSATASRAVGGTDVFGPLTVEQARDEAFKLLAEAAQGRNPQDARRSGRKALSVRELGARWLEDVGSRRKPGTAREYRRLWQKNVLPSFGSRAVSSVTNADIRKLHRSLHKTPYVANRVAARLSTFFEFAISEGAIPSKENPVHGIELYPECGRERFLTKECL